MLQINKQEFLKYFLKNIFDKCERICEVKIFGFGFSGLPGNKKARLFSVP